MSRLVEDLIVLAKTQRPDFLHTERVDLADLTDSVLTKERGLGERFWLPDDLADARTSADPKRLTQALLQFVPQRRQVLGAAQHHRPRQLCRRR